MYYNISMKNISPAQLKSRMREKNIRQSDIAHAIGCTQGHLSRLLNGNVSGNSKTFREVVRFLYSDEHEISTKGEKILDRLIKECWDGTLRQALIFDDIIRNAVKLSEFD